MTLAALNRHLTDLGGVTVLWDSDVGTLVQDPTSGGINQYGPGDLFRDADTGDIYQLQPGGSLALYRVAAAPTVPAPAGAPAPSVDAGSAVSSALPAFSTPAPPTTSTAAITPTGNPQQWGHQLVAWLSKASFISGMPNGLLLAAGYLGYTFYKQQRRRNPRPILRNPYSRRDRRAARHDSRELARRRGEIYGYMKDLPSREARDYYAMRRLRRRFLRGVR